MRRQWEQEAFGGSSPNRTLLLAQQRYRSSRLVGHDKSVIVTDSAEQTIRDEREIKAVTFLFLLRAAQSVIFKIALFVGRLCSANRGEEISTCGLL